ncbi:diguanylate cyclase domain-containing protein [Acidisoma sp.]|uniref:diguanylate cyclase domain-containing protein n=1 Tax=Acidisoma sp. TaxID=1872115 RepID=UPI003B007D51
MIAIRDIILRTDPVRAQETGAAVISRFQSEPETLVLPVLDESKRPIGVVERDSFLLAMAAQYGYSLYSRRPISMIMDRSPLIVEAETDLLTFASATIAYRSTSRLENFLVVDDGCYVGVGTPFRLLSALVGQLQHRAHHDGLTDLPNRVSFESRLQDALKRAGPAEAQAALLWLDLDDFKRVNDTMGHPAGDALLIAVSKRLRESIRPIDIAARMGGDEFAVLLSGGTAEVAAAVAERIIAAVALPVDADGQTIRVSASVGIGLAPQNGTDFQALTKAADVALYDAKAQGKGRFRFYESGMAKPPPINPPLEVGA